MSKNRCSFNELEFRRMANSLTPYLKEGTAKQAISDDSDSSKSPNKKAKINLIFWKWSFR
jgi:hypothetical protein